jgi:sugar phosphate isomerase/epimerase
MAPQRSLGEIKEAGFEGVQFETPSDWSVRDDCARFGFGMAGSGRINKPADAYALVHKLKEEGMECGTVHLGCGMESEQDGCALIDSASNAATQLGVPLYLETHRATLFQDMWRTVEFIKRFPELRFNGDFSHWYTGLEMVYGGFEQKLAFLAPVFE